MTREEPHSNSVSPAIINIRLSSEPISSEQKAQMLPEIHELMRRHNLWTTEVGTQLRLNY